MASPSNSHSTNNDHLDTAPNPSKDERRRARKRATDRNSQRQHRQRQQAYVRQLEETVQSFKTSFAQSSNSEIAVLLKEQERLVARCQKLEATLLRINGLANSVNEGERAVDEPAPDPECPSFAGGAHEPSAPPAVQQTKPLGDVSSASSGCSQASCDPLLSSLDQDAQPVPSVTVLDMPDTIMPQELDYFDLSDCLPAVSMDHASDIDAAQAKTAAPDKNNPTAVTAEGDTFEANGLDPSLERCITSILDGTAVSLDVLPMSLIRPDPPTPDIATTQPRLHSWGSSPPYLCFARFSNDLGSWDTAIMKMVNEARLQHRCGQFPTEEPSLRGVLSSQSTDVLASRLYHYICSSGPIPLHLMLSIFWVQYLLLRWYVLETLVDFLRIPEFMRPTDLEGRIPHRPCVGMLVWPDIRRTLIRDSNNADPEHIGMELLMHMSRNWVPTAYVTGDLIGSTDIFAIIERQSCRLGSWKVDRSFRDKHKQFINCGLD
ncbi:hypothetical protein EDB80DRAFT_701247 [Ilyonectria destructans]|nr:hypothetical protein EDB80DRAFT_701247 [Ilyonectria destructans]